MAEIRERQTITLYAILQFREIWNLYEIYYYTVLYVSQRAPILYVVSNHGAINLISLGMDPRSSRAHLSNVYAECGRKHQEKPRLLIISVQLSTARGLRVYFELSTAERFLVFSYTTTGQRLEEKKRVFPTSYRSAKRGNAKRLGHVACM